MDLFSSMIHMLNILSNRCNLSLPTCRCCEPSSLGPSLTSELTSLPKALSIILPKVWPKPLVLICTLKTWLIFFTVHITNWCTFKYMIKILRQFLKFLINEYFFTLPNIIYINIYYYYCQKNYITTSIKKLSFTYIDFLVTLICTIYTYKK